jgi:SAM-dependent methyltransferase
MKEVKEFWDAQARTHGESDLATAPDHFYRELEIANIIQRLPHKPIGVLDVGCGNGYTTKKLAAARPKAWFTGIDYSEEMIHFAKNRGDFDPNRKIKFDVGNCLHLEMFARSYDYVISTRCLINLADWEAQRRALIQMCNCLTSGGKLILVENFANGLRNLNTLRARVNLRGIEQRWHNRYIEFFELQKFIEEKSLVIEEKENIGCLYYIVTRVIYPTICEDPKYNTDMHRITSMMPSLGSFDWSPNYLIVLKAIQHDRLPNAIR